VVTFDRDRKFLRTWGQKGNEPTETRPGDMNTVHVIAPSSSARRRAEHRVTHAGRTYDVYPSSSSSASS
jgi:hypothetical protein